MLVDEGLGADVVRAAKSDGVVVLMPIEMDGSRVFELAYGDHFAEHVGTFDPDFFKARVTYNPADDEGSRRTADHTPGDGVRMGGTDEPVLDP